MNCSPALLATKMCTATANDPFSESLPTGQAFGESRMPQLLIPALCVCRQSKVQSCERCRDVLSSLEPLQASSPSSGPGRDGARTSDSLDQEQDGLKEQLRHLELELAQTKLQLVEAKCRIQVSGR